MDGGGEKDLCLSFRLLGVPAINPSRLPGDGGVDMDPNGDENHEIYHMSWRMNPLTGNNIVARWRPLTMVTTPGTRRLGCPDEDGQAIKTVRRI